MLACSLAFFFHRCALVFCHVLNPRIFFFLISFIVGGDDDRFAFDSNTCFFVEVYMTGAVLASKVGLSPVAIDVVDDPCLYHWRVIVIPSRIVYSVLYRY